MSFFFPKATPVQLHGKALVVARKEEFIASLLQFIQEYQISSVLFLSGVDSSNRTDLQMQVPTYLIRPPNSPPYDNTRLSGLSSLPIPEFTSPIIQHPSRISLANEGPVPFIPGGGLTRRMLSSIPPSWSVPTASILQFVLEGDNRQDAALMAAIVAKVLSMEIDEWKQPSSWKDGLFGTPHDQTLYGVHGRVAVITGGATGLGYWMAEAWVANGGKVYIVGRREAKLQEAVAKLNKIASNSAYSISADVSKQEDFLTQTWAHGEMTSALTPLLAGAAKKGEGRGSVILIGSPSGDIWNPLTKTDGNSVAKAGDHLLGKILATKLAGCGIRVNIISPGTFPSGMNDITQPRSPGHPDRVRDVVPLGRNGGADDIAGIFIWLASKAGAYVTGEKIQVDGGLLLTANGRLQSNGLSITCADLMQGVVNINSADAHWATKGDPT
ncbi:hypothetical protein EWM64_g4120 [Hericium alpestre]|uniref:NAD(P)-binding protein n=1 Tax=Hericium alpestre TaxID=135208 RepID=A0A4Z0A0M7_9AGAM|nr:hypothetical protein EWM64_g4120 [Hericium alpestre]